MKQKATTTVRKAIGANPTEQADEDKHSCDFDADGALRAVHANEWVQARSRFGTFDVEHAVEDEQGHAAKCGELTRSKVPLRGFVVRM